MILEHKKLSDNCIMVLYKDEYPYYSELENIQKEYGWNSSVEYDSHSGGEIGVIFIDKVKE